MIYFLIFLLCAHIVTYPFYVFPSGLPQPADFILFFISVILILKGDAFKFPKFKIYKYFFPFLLIVTFVNFFQWLYNFSINGVENKIFISTFYYIYNFLNFFSTAYLIKQLNSKKLNYLTLAIVVSLVLQITLSFLGIQGGHKDIETLARPSLFFNNPNQLGYYALLCATLFLTIQSDLRNNIFLLIFVFMSASYLILLSASRAAMGGMVILFAISLFQRVRHFNIKTTVYIIGILSGIGLLLQTEFFQNRLHLTMIRNNQYVDSDISQAEVRGYNRLWEYPQYLLIGAGEGLQTRFNSNQEIHSGFIAILFAYGILGFTLFIIVVYYSIRSNIFLNLLIILPILVYNLTHQGIRSSLFWILLSTLYIFTPTNKNQINHRNVKYQT